LSQSWIYDISIYTTIYSFEPIIGLISPCLVGEKFWVLEL